jgi:hypothetical protein
MVHANRPLTQISVAYRQDAKNFIADRVFPVVPVNNRSDTYYKFDKDDWFRSQAVERAPGTESVGSGWSLSTDSYECKTYALHKDIADEIRENQDQPLDMDRNATEFLTGNLLLQKDMLWASTYFGTGIWGTNWTGASATAYGSSEVKKWDLSGSDPVQDVMQAKLVVQQKTGFRPNKMVIGPELLRVLLNNANILDRIRYTQMGVVTEGLLASLFQVDELLVASAVKNTANEGAAFSGSFVFGDGALLAYSNPSPALEMPSAGYTFEWSGRSGAMKGLRVRRFRMDKLESDRIEASHSYGFKVVAADVGLFMADLAG